VKNVVVKINVKRKGRLLLKLWIKVLILFTLIQTSSQQSLKKTKQYQNLWDRLMIYRDSYGILHDKEVKDGNPETSENGPLYDGLYMVFAFSTDTLYSNMAWEYALRVELLYSGSYWQAVPGNKNDDFSRDNFAGIFMGLEVVERKAKKWKDKKLLNYIKSIKSKIPVLHKQLDHPRDFLQVIGFKYKLFRPFTMWASKLAAIISMYQTHKRHRDRPEGQQLLAKTDGKMIGLGLCIAFNWKWTQWAMTKLLDRKRIYPMPINAWHMVKKSDEYWKWEKWNFVFLDYFKTYEHDLVGKVKKWEEKE